MNNDNLKPILAAVGGAVVIVAVFLIAYLIGGSGSNSKTLPAPDHTPIQMLAGIPQHGNILGDPNAKLTLIEFADPQCSGCKWFSQNVIPQLISTYVRTGKVKIEYEGQTFIDQNVSQDSNRLLRMYIAAGEQNKFWQFTELVYANQGGEDSGYATNAWLKEIAHIIPGLNVDKAYSTWESKTFASQIASYSKDFSKFGFTATPSLLLGKTGQPITQKVTGTGNNVPDFAAVSAPIEAMLKS